MQTNSKYEYQPFECSGNEVRFHWNIQLHAVEDGPDLHYKAEEALCLVSDSTEVILQKLRAEQCPEELQLVLLDLWNNYKQGAN